ncbi:unnamed protein product [Thelazia callipaeda]|uniref:Transmembrane protein 115 n=1 Tax=Thelazia callipaeda TaxID=103827 RepID=A0A3P7K300_THECL|nr:unnamed protein product [Thelazia callipaeda]
MTFFFHTYIYGSLAACSAVSVAVKQYLPDWVLLSIPIGRIKNTHLPACIFFASSILVLFNLLRMVSLLQILLGIQISWMYLRFLQPHGDAEPRGDANEHFAWETLFPSKLQPFMRVLSSTAYSCLIKTHFCKPMARHIDLSHLDSLSVIIPNLQSKDTERRRQKALRDLTERLNRVQRAELAVWPEMDDISGCSVAEDIENKMEQKEKTEVQSPVSYKLFVLVLYILMK